MTAESIVFWEIFRGRVIELYLSSPPRAVRGTLWRRRSLLLALAGVHVLGFLLWPAPERATAPPADAGRHITWLTLPAAPTPRTAPTRARPAEPGRPRAAAGAPLRVPEQDRAPQAITLPTPAVAPTAAPPDPFAVAPARPTADDLKQALRNSAGAADRQLRKESWNPRDKIIASSQTALARGVGEAFRGDDGVSQENLLTPEEGRMMTKMRAGGSTYCAAMQSNGLVGGRDVFKNGVKTEVTSCPRYVK